MKSVVKNYPRLVLILFNLFVVGALLFGAELFLKFKKSESPVTYENYGTQRVINLRESRANFSGTLTADEQMLRISDNLPQTPYRMQVDQNGFIMPTDVYEKPDLKIFFLGGSTTMCAHNTEEFRFPYLSGKLLSEKTGLKINAYNGGFSSNNSLHSLNILLNKVIPQQPNIVVMMHACNDLLFLSRYGSYWNLQGLDLATVYALEPLPGPVKSIFKGLKDALFPNLWEATVKVLGTGKAAPESRNKQALQVAIPEEEMVEKFKSNLRLFVSMCRSAGTLPVLMTQANRLTENPDPAVKAYVDFLSGPYLHRMPLDYGQYRLLEARFNRAIREVASAENTPLIDLDKHIPRTKEYMYDPYHLTDEGCKLAAELISETLMQNPASKNLIAPQNSGQRPSLHKDSPASLK
jgi:lysophospholipase L1-like esterase